MHLSLATGGSGDVLGPVDAVIAGIAATQNGRVKRQQLLAAGVTSDAIKHRLRTGRLIRVHRGVYAVGHLAPAPLTRERQALLALGRDAVLSHGSAAAQWRLGPVPDGPVHVTVLRASARSRTDITVHRTILTDPRDFTNRLGLPVTSPARTILDLAEVLSEWDLERVVAEAQVLKLMTERTLHEALARVGRRKGAPKLRRVLQQSPGLTRSQYERILRRIVRDAGLPQPRTNSRIGRYEADFCWPDLGLIVEVNPYSTHGHRRAHAKDTRKAAELTALGYRVMGFTGEQLGNEPLYVAATLAAALAQSSSSTAGELARRTSASMPFAGSGREK